MKIIILTKNKLLIIGFIIVSLILGLLFFSQKEDVPTVSLPITNKVIVIDPGHGGVDPGALGDDGLEEEDINLEIALKLKRLLEQSGSIVILTREEDVGLYTEKSNTYRSKKNEDLRNRRIMVNEINPDMFITIHLNSFPQSKYYGAQTFYQKNSEEGKKLARLIQNQLKKVLDNDNNRVAQARNSIYLLREVKVLSILIECGFLSNPKEAQLLTEDKYQEKIAWSIYSGILQYINQGN